MHRFALPENLHAGTARHVLEPVDLVLDGGAHAAEVAAFRVAVDVEHPLHGVVIDPRRLYLVADLWEVGEKLGRGRGAVDYRRGQRGTTDGLDGVDDMLRRLDRN